MLDEAFLQVVGIRFRHCAAPTLWARRDGPTRGCGQGLGRAGVGLVTGRAPPRRHPSCPAVAVGLDDTGPFPEAVGTTQLMPTPGVRGMTLIASTA